MRINETLNQEVGKALKAHGLIEADAETSSQYFIPFDSLNQEEPLLPQIAHALADFDVHNAYLGMDALSGFSNGWLFTVREAEMS
jgi:hypothetical protein